MRTKQPTLSINAACPGSIAYWVTLNLRDLLLVDNPKRLPPESPRAGD
jgi:hypothetical protein